MASRLRARVGERISQIRLAYTHTREQDARLVVWMAAAAAVGFAIVLGVFILLGRPILGAVTALPVAATAALSVLARRSQRAAIAGIEGQPGAALAIIQSMRGAWRVTPAVAFSGKKDMVHRVVGRPGVILVGEGRKARVQALLRQEARRTSRVAGKIPVHEVNVGTGRDQVTLKQLRMHLVRLPRSIKTRQIGPLDRRLHALGGNELPIPKGPIPRIRRPR